MKQRALLTLGPGDWQQGFASVTLQLREADNPTAVQFSGSLPAAPALGQLFCQWRSLYDALYKSYGIWQRSASGVDASGVDDGEVETELEIEADAVTQVSLSEFIHLCQKLQHQINSWLESPTFRPLERQLRTHLSRSDEISLILAAERAEVLRYPWHLWQLFEDYPHSELALSPVSYLRSLKQPPQKITHQVNILAVLGNAKGIDVKTDQQILSILPGAAVTLLVEPTLDELHQQLWHGHWDIFFFAGHSLSREQGILQLNSTEHISIDQLKYALRTAIAKGLQLAIFNSCDGLGLAWDLADLHIPQVIVMREPVPDLVAQGFLKHFLSTFAEGESLYLAVRAAREQLQPLESTYPCATWLPVIVQNPAELPISWHDLQGGVKEAGVCAIASPDFLPKLKRIGVPRFSRGEVWPTLLTSLLLTSVVMALRLLGGLESWEIAAFDRLMRLRPAERPDPRLLVVTIGEADLQAQSPERRGSLSDAALEQLLTELDRHQARVVGIDVYRDYPVSSDYPALARRLQNSERIVGVCKSRDPLADPLGVAPPPELVEDLVGFSDFIDDADGVVRRQLVSLEADPAATCTTPYAFNARLAFLYLQGEGVTPGFNDDGNLTLGEAVFPRLRPRSGGYQPIDAGGNQILLNYHALDAPTAIADQVSLTQLLNGEINPEAMRDRIVIIGVTATSLTDAWATPYGKSSEDKTAGVFLQAQMTSQLISAALGERPVLKVFSIWGDVLWIVGWATIGWIVGIAIRSSTSRVWGAAAVGIGVGLLMGGSLWLLIVGYWVPLVPGGLVFLGSSFGTANLWRLSSIKSAGESSR